MASRSLGAFSALSALVAVLGAACGEGSKYIPPPTGSDSGGGSCEAGPDGAGCPSCTPKGCAGCAKNAQAGICCGSRPANDEFCHASCAEKSCTLVDQRPIDSCCVLVGDPLGKAAQPPLLARTGDTKEYAGSGPPDLGCFDAGKYPKAGTSKKVTMKGVVKIFANGCSSDGVQIEVYTVKRTGGADDGMPDQLVGKAVKTDKSGAFDTEEVKKCSDPRKLYKYEYADVPTYTELMVVTSDASGLGRWAKLYDYNQYVFEDDPEFDKATSTYTHPVRAIASDDYQTIPNVAIGRTIAPGNGAIGGEIHDCSNVRLQNAAVDVDVPRAALVYFTPNEEEPMPDTAQTSLGRTGRLALYAALDVKEGPFTMAAVGLVDGGASPKLVTLGYFKARVFADSVTALSLRGVRPYQAPK